MAYTVTNIQRFSTHDGPGLRTVVFFKGCPLSCMWCHNPETHRAERELFYVDRLCVGCGECIRICERNVHSFGDTHVLDRDRCRTCMKCADMCPTGALEACGKEYSLDELVWELMRDKPFYGKVGGVTLSGGEPMLCGDGIIPLLKKIRECGVTTTIETCGYFDSGLLPKVVPLTDLFLWDIKDTDSERHLRNTGVSPEFIWENLRAADALGAKTLLRCVMMHGINMERDHYEAVGKIYSSLKNCMGVELLPYHTFGSDKAVQLGRECNAHPEFIPSKAEMEEAKEIISAFAPVI